MDNNQKTFRVINRTELWYMRLPDHLEHGYEEEDDFRTALKKLVDHWHDRKGEAVEERNGHLLLRFYDTPGSTPDEAWLPSYLLQPVNDSRTKPDTQEDSSIEKEINSSFGFD